MFPVADYVYSIWIIFLDWSYIWPEQRFWWSIVLTTFSLWIIKDEDAFGSELASSSEILPKTDHITCAGCVFCRTQLNPSTTSSSSVTGKQCTLSSNEIPIIDACTTKNVICLITYGKCCMQYVGMTTTNIRTRFVNHRSCIKIINAISCCMTISVAQIMKILIAELR